MSTHTAEPLKRKVAILSFEEGLQENTVSGYSQSQKIFDALVKLCAERNEASRGTTHFEATRLAWSDSSADWSEIDLAIPIEVWDYYLKLPQFVEWLHRLAQPENKTQLANGVNVVLFNMCKLYLAEMNKRGVSIVPTKYIGNPNAADFTTGRPDFAISDQVSAMPSDEEWKNMLLEWKNGVVVKPTISAGSHGTIRVLPEEASPEKLKATVLEILKDTDAFVDAMVQPYLPEIETDGERSMIFLHGKFLHAIQKKPREGDFRVQKKHGGVYEKHSPSPVELHFGELAISTAQAIIDEKYGPGFKNSGITYARVDYVMMELELIEPELFIPYSDFGEEGFEHVASVFLDLLK